MTSSLPSHANVMLLEKGYRAYAESDLTTLAALYSDDVVFHVAGRHPLSGDYLGMDAVLGYMLRVAEIGTGGGGFEVEGLFADDDTAIATVIGTIHCGGREFRRRIVHVNRVVNGQIHEFWDLPFDQHAEDEFWVSAVG